MISIVVMIHLIRQLQLPIHTEALQLEDAVAVGQWVHAVVAP